MGSFDLLVPIDSNVYKCCDVAVTVDRQIYPHMRHQDDLGKLDWYRINPDDPRPPYAFIDLGGCWRSQHRPSEIDPHDGEEGYTIPLDEWRAEVDEWVQELPRLGLRAVTCRCHD